MTVTEYSYMSFVIEQPCEKRDSFNDNFGQNIKIGKKMCI